VTIEIHIRGSSLTNFPVRKASQKVPSNYTTVYVQDGLVLGGLVLERDNSHATDAMPTLDDAAPVGLSLRLLYVPVLDRPFRRLLSARLALLSALRLHLLPFKELPLVLSIVASIPISGIGQHWVAMTTSRGDADGGWRGLSWAGLRTHRLSRARSTVSTAVIRSAQRSTSDTRPSAARWALKLSGLTMADVLQHVMRGNTLPVVDGSAPVGPGLRLHSPFSVRSARPLVLSDRDRPIPGNRTSRGSKHSFSLGHALG
jgi:hypothetical protein